MDLNVLLFFIGTGVALFVALLAWGDDIRTPRKEVLELERRFRNKFKLKKKTISPLLRKLTEYSFLDKMGSIIKLGESRKFKGRDLALITKMREINAHKEILEKGYKIRYFCTIAMDLFCFVAGSLYYLTNGAPLLFEKGYLISQELVFGGIILIGFFFVLYNLVKGYFEENTFIKLLYEFGDQIEG